MASSLKQILGSAREWVSYLAADGQTRAYTLEASLPNTAKQYGNDLLSALKEANLPAVNIEAIDNVGVVIDAPLELLKEQSLVSDKNLTAGISKPAAISAAILSSTSLWLPPEGEVSDTSIHTAWFAGSQAEALLKYADEAKKTGTQSSLQVQAVVERPRYILEGAIQPNDSVFVQASLSRENLKQLKIPMNVIQGALLATQLRTELQR